MQVNFVITQGKSPDNLPLAFPIFPLTLESQEAFVQPISSHSCAWQAIVLGFHFENDQ